MSHFVYSKKFEIKNKVFNDEDILCFARIFTGLFKDGDCHRCITLEFDDESKLEGDSIEVFSTDEFRRRRCVGIFFEYISKGYEHEFLMRFLNAALTSANSYGSLRSIDKEWYESTLKRFETAIEEVKNQNKLIQNPLLDEGWISFAELLLLCFMALRVPYINSFLFSIPWIAPVLMFSLIHLVILRWNYNLVQKLRIAYPNIEFAFGADHKNESLRAKHIIAIAAPFGFEIIVFLLEWCFL